MALVILAGMLAVNPGSARAFHHEADFLITPTGLDFGVITVGDTSPSQHVGVTYLGGGSVTVDVEAGAIGGGFFMVDGCDGVVLATGATCNLTYSFTPSTDGPSNSISTLTVNGQAAVVTLHGAGVVAGVALHAKFSVVDFGMVQVGVAVTIPVDIVNAGTAPVVMSGAGGAVGEPFSAAQSCQGVTLDPGESCQMVFRFTPTVVGAASATSHVTWNGVAFAFDLTGTGIDTTLDDFLITPTGLDFGQVTVGTTSSIQTVQVTNVATSPRTLAVAGGAVAGPFTAVQNCQGVTLAPGASCQFSYSFSPATLGDFAAVSSFVVNGRAAAVALHGEGIYPTLDVMIDIDPESTNNRIRLRPAGLVTVVAFGSASFAVGDVDAATVRFADAAIARRGNGTLHLSTSDVNVDGIPDLVMKFRVLDTSLGVGDSTATLTGFTLGLVPFAGSDTIEVR